MATELGQYVKARRAPPAPGSALAAALSELPQRRVSLVSLLRRGLCLARTHDGRRCRAAPVHGGAFCASHWRAGAGVRAWGGPADGSELRPENNGELAKVLVAVEHAHGLVRYHGGAALTHSGDTLLGIYTLRQSRYVWSQADLVL